MVAINEGEINGITRNSHTAYLFIIFILASFIIITINIITYKKKKQTLLEQLITSLL